MTTTSSVHDKFVKFMMSDPRVAMDFFIQTIPLQLLEQLDLSTLHLENSTFISRELEKEESDLIFSLKMRKSDRQAYFYILLEHQSTPDLMMPLRLLFYMMQFYKRYLLRHGEKLSTLPFMYSKILYNGKGPWNYPLDIPSFFEPLDKMSASLHEEFIKKMFLGPFDLVDVGRMVSSDFEQNHWSNLMLASLHRTEKKLELQEKAQILGNIVRNLRIKADSPLVYAMLNYNLYSSECEPEIYYEVFRQSLPNEYQEVVMNIAQALKQEGRQEGRREGFYDIARKMVLRGTALKEAAELAELTPDQIKRLIEETLR